MKLKAKLIAVDLDGTLLAPDGKLSPKVAAACRKALACGVMLVPATGQRFRSVLTTVASVLSPSHVIAHNGAVVKRVSDSATVHESLMPNDLAAEVVEHLKRRGLEPLVFVDGHVDGVDYYKTFDQAVRSGTTEYLSLSTAHARTLTSFQDLPYDGVIKILRLASAVSSMPPPWRFRWNSPAGRRHLWRACRTGARRSWR